MPQYMTHPSASPPQEHLEHVAEAYERSEMFVDDALDWFADNAHSIPAAVELACDYFRESDKFDTRCDDFAAGEC